MAKKYAFSIRGLISLLVFASFLGLGITGLVLFFVPQGRVSYWVNWSFLGLGKDSWAYVHILFALLFLITGIWHLVLNWKPLVGYIKGKAKAGFSLRLELPATVVVAVLIFLSGVFLLPPLSYVIDLNAAVKDAWGAREGYEPPFGHAEELSLRAFAARMRIDLEQMTAALKSKGIAFESTKSTLKQVAEANGITPAAVYAAVKHLEPKEMDTPQEITADWVDLNLGGKGYGRKTIAEVCLDFKLEPETALARLSRRGIQAGAEETVKAVADKSELTALDVLKIILDAR